MASCPSGEAKKPAMGHLRQDRRDHNSMTTDSRGKRHGYAHRHARQGSCASAVCFSWFNNKTQVRRIRAVACRQTGAHSRARREIRSEAVPAVGNLSVATAARAPSRLQENDHRFTRKTTRISTPARPPRIVWVSSMLFVVQQQKPDPPNSRRSVSSTRSTFACYP